MTLLFIVCICVFIWALIPVKKTISNKSQTPLPFVCRFCGLEMTADNAKSYCATGPCHCHEMIANTEDFVCKYCGQKLKSYHAKSSCMKFPQKSHVLISAKTSYTCRYCGRSGKDPSFAISYCEKSANHCHELID